MKTKTRAEWAEEIARTLARCDGLRAEELRQQWLRTPGCGERSWRAIVERARQLAQGEVRWIYDNGIVHLELRDVDAYGQNRTRLIPMFQCLLDTQNNAVAEGLLHALIELLNYVSDYRITDYLRWWKEPDPNRLRPDNQPTQTPETNPYPS